MATVLEKIVDPDGSGDYTTLNAWEAAYGGVASNGDCVGQDTIARALCRCTGGTADGTATAISGWTATSATQYAWVYVDTAYRHKGKYATGNVYRFSDNTTTWGFRVDLDHTHIEGVLSCPRYDAQYVAAFYADADVTGVYFDDCIAYGGLMPAINGYGFQVAADSGKVKYLRNCLAYDVALTGGRGYTLGTTAGGVHLSCCLAIGNAGMGFRTVSASVNTAKNCVSFDNGDDWNGTWLGSYNGFKEGAAPTTSDIDLSGDAGTDLWTDYDNDVFHVKTGGHLDNAGQNLYADGTLPVTDDYRGMPRPSSGAFDLGWDERTLAAGAVVLSGATVDGVATFSSASGWDATGSVVLAGATVTGQVNLAWNVTGAIVLAGATVDADAAGTYETYDAPGAATLGAITVAGTAWTYPYTRRKVDTGNSPGTHYTSLQAWEDAFGGVANSGDCVGQGKVALAECYATTGVADTYCRIYGWTATSATRGIEIKVAEGYRHALKYPASGNVYRIAVTGATGLSIEQSYVTIDGVSVKITANANYAKGVILKTVQGCTVKNCVVQAVPGAYTNVRCFMDYLCATGTNKFINCLGYGSTGTQGYGTWIQNRTGGSVYLSHCGHPDGLRGFAISAGSGYTIVARNCYAYTSEDSFTTGFAASSSYNAYKTGADPGANGIDISGDANTDLFADPTSSNWHVKSSGNLYNACPTLYADANTAVTTDAEYQPRPATGTCECGPDESLFATGAITLGGATVSGVAAWATTDWNVTGAIVLPAVTVSGAWGNLTYSATGAIYLGVATVAGGVSMTPQGPLFPATLHGYETFPLSPEHSTVEQIGFWVASTDATAPATVTRAIRDKMLRRWRLRWEYATATDVDTFRGFVRDVRGGSLPFWWDAIDPVARPYNGPTLGSTESGSLAERTRYVKFTWTDADGETLPSVEYETLMVGEGELLTATIPDFPQNVVGANIYVGPTNDEYHKQATAITTTGGMWTEPVTGYDVAGAVPPTANTLSERVLVHFGDNSISVTKHGPNQYEIQCELAELWVENPRASFATGAITLAAAVVAGTADVSVFNSTGAITLAAATVAGVAEKTHSTAPGSTWDVIGHATLPAATVEGVSAEVILGTYYVSSAGDNGNTGTSYGDPFLTIQHAVDVAATGSTIVVAAGTYVERVTFDGSASDITLKANGTAIIQKSDTYGIYASAATDNITIEGFTITGQSYGIYAIGGDSWTITDCTIHDCTVGGIVLNGVRNSSYVYSDGNSHTVDDNIIYKIGNTTDAIGIVLSYCKNCSVSGNELYLCAKQGIKDIYGEANTTQNNIVHLCGVGIGLDSTTTAAVVYNNYVHHCGRGFYARATAFRTGKAWNAISYNTAYQCGTGIHIGYNNPDADALNIHHNVWKHNLDQHVAYDADDVGTNVTIDRNFYWSTTEMSCAWDNESFNCYSMWEIRTDTRFEDNGVEYSGTPPTLYGHTGLTQTTPNFTMVDWSVDSASRNKDFGFRLLDWEGDTAWYTGVGYATNQYIILDAAGATSWNLAILWVNDPDAEHTPKTFTIDSSTNKSSWTNRISAVNNYDQGFKWFAPASAVTDRYLRLYVTDKFSTDGWSWTVNEIRLAGLMVGTLA